jgi:anti-sigma regulatory factor (Ser/Thr protein kinase)
VSELPSELGRAETLGVDLTITARPENLSLARLALAGVAASAAVPAEIVADLKLAVTEACTNVIQHAYAGTGEGEIMVRYVLADGILAVEVEDVGVGFDPERPSPSRNGHGPGQGLGLLIIRELSDELTVTSGETGSCLRFRRRFSLPS